MILFCTAWLQLLLDGGLLQKRIFKIIFIKFCIVPYSNRFAHLSWFLMPIFIAYLFIHCHTIKNQHQNCVDTHHAIIFHFDNLN